MQHGIRGSQTQEPNSLTHTHTQLILYVVCVYLTRRNESKDHRQAGTDCFLPGAIKCSHTVGKHKELDFGVSGVQITH